LSHFVFQQFASFAHMQKKQGHGILLIDLERYARRNHKVPLFQSEVAGGDDLGTGVKRLGVPSLTSADYLLGWRGQSR
jgi:hypothetical protein